MQGRAILAGLLVLIVCIGSGCAPASSETPPMSDSVFVEVLVQLHLADARVYLAEGHQEHETEPATLVRPSALRDSVLLSLEVDSTRYVETVAYYAAHPDEFVVRYNEVLERLNALDL